MATERSAGFYASAPVPEDVAGRFFSLLARSRYDTGTDTGLTASAYTSGATGGFRIALGRALVEGFYYELVADAGGSTKDFAVAANTAGQPVGHRMFLTLDRNASTITLTRRAGAPSAAATPPTPTVTASLHEVPICRGVVAPGAAVVTNVVSERAFLDPQPAYGENGNAGTSTARAGWDADLVGSVGRFEVPFTVPPSGSIKVDFGCQVSCSAGWGWGSVRIANLDNSSVIEPPDPPDTRRAVGVFGNTPIQAGSYFELAELTPGATLKAVFVHRVYNAGSTATFDNRRIRVEAA